MGLSVCVGDKSYEIGSGSFLNAFFSTVLVKLEDDRWGSRFPLVMNEFYSGRIKYDHVKDALKELHSIQQMLGEYSPDQIVWDFERREAVPPWGNNISPSITNLANYFVTSDGEDLFAVLITAFNEAAIHKQDVRIE